MIRDFFGAIFLQCCPIFCCYRIHINGVTAFSCLFKLFLETGMVCPYGASAFYFLFFLLLLACMVWIDPYLA